MTDGVPPRLAAALAALGARTGHPIIAVAAEVDGHAGERAAGARATRTVLGALGVRGPAADDPHHDDGRPCWPAGTTGSRAHAAGIAVAVAATAPLHWLGIDLECSAALPADDAAAVLDPIELAVVRAHPAPDAEATRVWSAKEAAFKAWCEATDGGLGRVDPVDLLVTLHEPDADGLRHVTVRAAGALVAPTAPIGPLTGWCADTGDHVVVLVSSARSRRVDHHGADGMASAAITSPSAANAST